MQHSLSRRAFLGASAASIAFPSLRSYAGSTENRIRVGVMGTSRNSIGGDGRGTTLASGFAQRDNCEVAYVCDVDSRNVGKAIESVSQHQSKPPEGVRDFRRILDDPTVDLLAIAAPDHWHGPATILGCAAGKHVYVEKPCCHNPGEGELMVQAARKYKRHVQVGTQRRSWPGLREAIGKLHGGMIGKVSLAEAFYFNDRPSIGQGKKTPVPDWLDWKLWQGPAPHVPYRDNVVHYNWHWFWHWGTAELGNNGVHTLDVCRWGLNVDYPSELGCQGEMKDLGDDRETPTSTDVMYAFTDTRFMKWTGRSCQRRTKEDPQHDVRFEAENGDLLIHGGKGTFVDRNGKVIEKCSGRGGDQDHQENVLEAIRENEKLNCSIEEGYKSTLLCHLGNISYRLGKAIVSLDPENGRPLAPTVGGKAVASREEVESLWTRDYEPGWKPTI